MNYYDQYQLVLIKKFMEKVTEFCNEHGIPTTLASFLLYRDLKDVNSDLPTTFNQLMTAPKLYLVASKSFNSFYNTLDPDMKKEIFFNKSYEDFHYYLSNNNELKKEIKEIIGDDATY